ncbi:MAG: AI-2E family transporter [Bacteroidales bacterium]|nr:AI-2E family transporter [Bacteroidales bacterium]MDD4215736.1 AI-2E family transporter [Bacteroidales bacterium]MDY0140343.1 AI-2E family transporter [Bacteroidales bacterium]
MEKYQKYIVGAFGLGILILFVIYFTHIIGWILIALLFATLGSPMVKFIRRMRIKKFVIPKWIAALVTLATMWFIIVLAFRLLIPLVVDQIGEFQAIDIETISEGLEKPIKNLDDFIQQTPIINQPNFSTEDFVIERITSIVSFTSVGNFINDLGGTAWNLFLSIFSITFICFFFLKDTHLFDKGVLMIIPKNYEEKAQNVLNSIRNLIARYLLGVILETLFMMTLFTLGLYLIGVPFDLALLVGMIGGVLNVIPYVGPWIGATIGIILITTANIQLDFYTEIMPLILKIIGVVAVAQLTDNIVFQPLIYSKSVKAHPLEIFFVIIIAGSIYGVLGMMLAIPGYTVLRVVLKEFLSQYKFVQQLTQNMDSKKSKPKKTKDKDADL